MSEDRSLIYIKCINKIDLVIVCMCASHPGTVEENCWGLLVASLAGKHKLQCQGETLPQRNKVESGKRKSLDALI